MQLTEENLLIEELVRHFPRSPRQINALQESDAELIRLNDRTVLAVTTDSICEETERGLYDDLFELGWMTVAVNMSDLAAVGAAPLGILLSQTLTHELDPGAIARLQHGIAAACSAYGVHVLGGDTNFSSRLQMGTMAIGMLSEEQPLMRTGCSPGDILYASGTLGSGNAYAFTKLAGCADPLFFRPRPRIDQGRLLAKHASCCMDTSDGLFAALDQLMRVNHAGFALTAPLPAYLSQDAKDVCRRSGLPEWFMLAGPHGEFELVFTIPNAKNEMFLCEARAAHWFPIALGETVSGDAVTLRLDGATHCVDTASIRNLFARHDQPLEYYVSRLHALKEQWRKP